MDCFIRIHTSLNPAAMLVGGQKQGVKPVSLQAQYRINWVWVNGVYYPSLCYRIEKRIDGNVHITERIKFESIKALLLGTCVLVHQPFIL